METIENDTVVTKCNSTDESRQSSMDSDHEKPLMGNNSASKTFLHCPTYEQPCCNLLEEATLKRELKFFFMNPIEKWNARRRFPYKFLVQVIKIVFITVQLCLYAESRYKHANYTWNNQMTFSHIFLYKWESTREITSYPPAIGPLAVYHTDTFYDAVDYTLNGYKNLSNAIGPYAYVYHDNGTVMPMEICLYQYRETADDSNNSSSNADIFSMVLDSHCFKVSLDDFQSFKSLLAMKDLTLSLQYLIKLTLNFSIKSMKYKNSGANCYVFDIVVTFDNTDMDGQMRMYLDTRSFLINCYKKSKAIQEIPTSQNNVSQCVTNYLVIAICAISWLLCIRSIYRAQLLKYKTITFFKLAKKRQLSMESRLDFWNFWYIMIIINDVLIIIGSYMQEGINHNQYTSEKWNLCSLLLGTGNLLVWFGVLRYLGFFNKYNVVILTLKLAFPTVIRFLLCAVLLYAGFVFCGWLVLGPFHMKFQTLSSTSECLFSLINGDDMFATFNIMDTKSTLLWWYSRLYIYSFTSLFIYVILSLFISVISDSYETIKHYYSEGFPKSDLHLFMHEADGNIQDITDENQEYEAPSSCKLGIVSFFQEILFMLTPSRRRQQN